MKHISPPGLTVVVIAAALACLALEAWPHCDTLEGPVVQDAQKAIEQRDVTPVLKWVSGDDEAEIREAFETTLAVRDESEAAREMADHYFFETLVRVHRATEGFGYTGLKPISTVDPVIREADQALEIGSADELIEHLSEQVEHELRERFETAHEARQHADESVQQGRDYVQAYVQFVHLVEAVREALAAEHYDHAEEGSHGAHEKSD